MDKMSVVCFMSCCGSTDRFPSPSSTMHSPCDVSRFLLVVIVGYQRNAWKRPGMVQRRDRVEVELEVKLFQGLVGGLPDKPGD